MAGIGIELKKILRNRTYFNIFRAYSYASILGTGPWLISILGLLFIDLIMRFLVASRAELSQFQVTVTYLISFSLIFSGFAQHSFTRYIADRLFEKRGDRVVPNYVGLILIMSAAAGIVGYLLSGFFFAQESFLYRLLLAGTFVVLCNIWLGTNLLSGLKAYRTILLVFLIGYSVSVAGSYWLNSAGLIGYMLSFFVGQFLLLLGIMIAIHQHYDSNRILEFDCLKNSKIYYTLIFASVFYNIGIWADKYLFWIYPDTSQHVIGILRSSAIYDMPMFLAFLTIIPGLAVFMFRIEADFSRYYERYYNAIRDGGTLAEIRKKHAQIVETARDGIYDIIKVQGFFIFTVFIVGPRVIAALGISQFYLYLFKIDTVAVGLLAVFIGLLNIIFYLDRTGQAMLLSIIFAVSNILFTLITLYLGVFFFGYGFVMSLFITVLIAMLLLDRNFKNLEYETFMLR